MMRLMLSFILLICTQTAMAELGRLFFTPAERARLEELRANAKSVELTELPTADTPIQIAPPRDISVQGYVKRGDGKKSTVWINGQPVQENTAGAGVEVGKIQSGSNQVPLMLPGSGRSIKLKAGQMYDPVNDQITDVRASSHPQKNDAIEAPTLPEAKIPPEVLDKVRELKRN